MEYIDLKNKNLMINFNDKAENSIESNTYFATYKGNEKIVKLLKNENDIENKIKKIILLKDRLHYFDYVVTADSFITNKDKVIGYMMPYIYAKNVYFEIPLNKREYITYLKKLSEMIKQLHKQNIVLADFHANTLMNKDKKIYLIDHDNFAIDKYPVDKKNIYLKEYEKHVKTFDKNFDYYMLNLYTISILSKIYTPYVCDNYRLKPFKFKDEEINNILVNTINLKDKYNEDLIIDKINDDKDLKKVKIKNI